MSPCVGDPPLTLAISPPAARPRRPSKRPRHRMARSNLVYYPDNRSGVNRAFSRFSCSVNRIIRGPVRRSMATGARSRSSRNSQLSQLNVAAPSRFSESAEFSAFLRFFRCATQRRHSPASRCEYLGVPNTCACRRSRVRRGLRAAPRRIQSDNFELLRNIAILGRRGRGATIVFAHPGGDHFAPYEQACDAQPRSAEIAIPSRSLGSKSAVRTALTFCQ